MSRVVFVDSSALISLGNRRDEYHDLAKKRFKEIADAKKYFITTHGVILEVANTFSSAKYKPIAIRLIELVHQSEKWQIFYSKAFNIHEIISHPKPCCGAKQRR